MPFPFSKPVDLILDTWTITRPYPLYPSLEHRTLMESGSKDLMNFRIGIGDPAASLVSRLICGEVGKPGDLFIPFLLLHFRIVEAPPVYSRWCTRFEPVAFKPPLPQLFCDARRGFFSHSTAPHLFFTNMN